MFLGHQAVTGEATAPRLSVTVASVEAVPGGHAVEVEVRNDGGQR